MAVQCDKAQRTALARYIHNSTFSSIHHIYRSTSILRISTYRYQHIHHLFSPGIQNIRYQVYHERIHCSTSMECQVNDSLPVRTTVQTVVDFIPVLHRKVRQRTRASRTALLLLLLLLIVLIFLLLQGLACSLTHQHNVIVHQLRLDAQLASVGICDHRTCLPSRQQVYC